MEALDLTGNKYGRLLVIEKLPSEKNGTTRSKTKHRCLCDCGRESLVATSKLTTGYTKSCGCLRYNLNDDAALQHVIYIYKRNAKNANRVFELTDEQCREITSQDCHYCGKEPLKRVRKITHDYYYNGIDRKDNEIGYIYENCLPCCEICNRMKMKLGYDEFIAQCSLIATHFNSLRSGILADGLDP